MNRRIQEVDWRAKRIEVNPLIGGLHQRDSRIVLHDEEAVVHASAWKAIIPVVFEGVVNLGLRGITFMRLFQPLQRHFVEVIG